jgi:hypothetical protein
MVGGCPGTLASSTTKTGRHDIAEILLKVAFQRFLRRSFLKIDQSEFSKSHVGHVF